MVPVPAQPLNQKLADIIYDPFVDQEKAENQGAFGTADLTAHYQATLVDGDSFYTVQKTGTYISCNPAGSWINGDACGPNAWNSVIWNVARYDWVDDQAQQAWMFTTDWKPERNATNFVSGGQGLSGWEPVFHPALAGGYLYVPGAGGTVWKVDLHSGKPKAQINPFARKSIDPANTFVSGPLAANTKGDVYYNVIEINPGSDPWDGADVVGAWLVKISFDNTSAIVPFAQLVPQAPPGNSTNCPANFFFLGDNGASLPWPPKSPRMPPTQICGSQRPGVNIGPAIGPDGTVYTASVAHYDPQVTYLVAANPDLSPKWASSLQFRLTDGCGVLLPIAPRGDTTEPSSCRFGTRVGVDPTTNAKGSGQINDFASSSPTVLPDGSITMGTFNYYDYARGHLMHFDAQGNYLNAFDFGWDSTAAVYQHDDTYSLVIKDNHYGGSAYCYFNNPVCAVQPPGPYYLTQLDSNMNIEWSFQNTTIDKDHPNGYEWCVNAPAIDGKGIVYGSSEDGHLYSVPQGHTGVFTKPLQKIFLLEALGAAYTPLSIGEDGKVYTQNNGHLFLVGEQDAALFPHSLRH